MIIHDDGYEIYFLENEGVGQIEGFPFYYTQEKYAFLFIYPHINFLEPITSYKCYRNIIKICDNPIYILRQTVSYVNSETKQNHALSMIKRFKQTSIYQGHKCRIHSEQKQK